MIKFLTKKIFGTFSEKKLKEYRSVLPAVEKYEEEYKGFNEDDCKSKTAEFKERLANGEDFNAIVPQAFALVRHAAQKAIGQRHYDVQIIGALALNDGQIAEMKTGEGKTLTSTLAVYANALRGKGVHVVTVNDYLAKRDSEWMGQVYSYLGVSTGLITHDMNDSQRREAYRADITYGTNNEFGFDFLRDNMKYRLDDYVQRGHAYAIVDEVDSILIDEARTPLIISGPSDDSTDKYSKLDQVMYGLSRALRISDGPEPEKIAEAQKIEVKDVKSFLRDREQSEIMIPGDYTLEEKSRNIHLTDQGVEKIEQRIPELLKTPNLYDLENIEVLHHVNQALKARYIFKRDVDYVVQNGQVVIVDEFTGRLMEGRRFSDGLHQALEAKERVKIERENQTLASITFQNYFRKYDKLSGMTGTAETEEDEFMKIYNLGVVVVPTNKPMIRKDQSDVIYKTVRAKNKAIVTEIQRLHKKKQPVLVGTASIENSEIISALLKKAKVPHNVLNAKQHASEAEIVANAGQFGMVTIATNMAGRGTDIQINDEVKENGGLYILGTERHESRRIDNQLRGRSGRQGDPGESRFYLSLEDDLLRIFGGDRIASLMNRLKIDEDEAIEHILISKAIENSQKKVEAHNFDIRKHLLEYDDVMNRQREIIYEQRKDILSSDTEEVLEDMIDDVLSKLFEMYLGETHSDQWDHSHMLEELKEIFNDHSLQIQMDEVELKEQLFEKLKGQISTVSKKRKEEFGEYYNDVLRQVLLEITDFRWKDHLLSMDHLKEGIGLRGYAQKNPLDEYKKEAYWMFADLMDRISKESVTAFFNVEIVKEPVEPKVPEFNEEIEMIHGELPSQEADKKSSNTPLKSAIKIGRNEPCPCGSGKKYKNCHMKEYEADQAPA